MTVYRYEAARADGAIVRGRLEAPSGSDAARLLSGRGLFPVDVQAARSPPVPWRRRPGTRATATVLRSLASLTAAGVPLARALEATAQLVTGPLSDAVGRVRDRVREGTSLAGAMQAEGALFPAVSVGLVRAGEHGVGLDAALAQAAEQLERRADLEARVRAALAYPVLLLAVGAVSVAVIALVIVPRFAGMLQDVGGALPPATRLLLHASEAAQRHGLLLVGAGAAGIAGLLALARAHPLALHRWLLELPLVGPIRHALAGARATRSLGALLGAGASALPALEAAREASGDAAVAARIERARGRVFEGAALSSALRETGALTPVALELAAIGEGAGTLPELLARAAELDESVAERRLKAALTLLEPALILAFAALVAFVAAALLQAIYAVRPV